MRLPIIIVVCCILIFSGYADLWPQNMDVRLDEVVVRGTLRRTVNTTSRSEQLDSILTRFADGQDLTRLISQWTGVTMTHYGSRGSLASVRMRGTGSSHTQLNWNGFPLNSITAGGGDLSMLSQGMIDQVTLVYGAPGSLFGSGTFGGAINFDNQSDWSNRLQATMLTEVGSWHHRQAEMGLKTGNSYFQYHLNTQWQKSDNAFRYRNYFLAGNPDQTRVNDTLSRSGIVQHFFLRLPGNWFIKAGSWWSWHDKDLPGPISSTLTGLANQYSKGNRNYIQVRKRYSRTVIDLHAGVFNDSLIYRDPGRAIGNPTDLISVMKSRRVLSGAKIIGYFRPDWSWQAGAEWDRQEASSANYTNHVKENRGSLMTSLQYHGNVLHSDVSIRMEMSPFNGVYPLFSLGTVWQTPLNNIQLRGQAGNRIRTPNLNDRYWIPGGNPALLPETGLGGEAGLSYNGFVRESLRLQFGTTFYHQQINNWIQWVPAGTYYSPRNVRRVASSGLEVTASSAFQSGKSHYRLSSNYLFNLSSDESKYDRPVLDRQLAYIPYHSLTLGGILSRGWFSFTTSYRFTGKRFTTDDHHPLLALEPIHDFDAGITLHMKALNTEYRISGRVENLLNRSNEWVRGYPSIGRSWTLTLKVLFIQTKSQNN